MIWDALLQPDVSPLHGLFCLQCLPRSRVRTLPPEFVKTEVNESRLSFKCSHKFHRLRLDLGDVWNRLGPGDTQTRVSCNRNTESYESGVPDTEKWRPTRGSVVSLAVLGFDPCSLWYWSFVGCVLVTIRIVLRRSDCVLHDLLSILRFARSEETYYVWLLLWFPVEKGRKQCEIVSLDPQWVLCAGTSVSSNLYINPQTSSLERLSPRSILSWTVRRWPTDSVTSLSVGKTSPGPIGPRGYGLCSQKKGRELYVNNRGLWAIFYCISGSLCKKQNILLSLHSYVMRSYFHFCFF